MKMIVSIMMIFGMIAIAGCNEDINQSRSYLETRNSDTEKKVVAQPKKAVVVTKSGANYEGWEDNPDTLRNFEIFLNSIDSSHKARFGG